jgi:ribosome-associated protein
MSKSIAKRAPGSKRPSLPADVAQAVRAASAKQATDIVVLDLRTAAGFTDFFVICTGHNPRQIRAIADAIEESVAKGHARPAHVEGYERSEWVLLDYFDFVVHVFNEELRAFYALERLWGSAAVVDVSALVDAPTHTVRS